MEEQFLPHTAVPTWSGFIYQGRVALYHVLKLLNEKTEQELNTLYIQIDSIEDFAIITYDDNVVTPLTIHQVKAVNSHLYSTYEDDFKKLENKKTELQNVNTEALFHLCIQNEKTKDEINALHPLLNLYSYENNEYFCSLDEIDNKIKNLIILVRLKYNNEVQDNINAIEFLYDILEKRISDTVVNIHCQNHNGTPIRVAAYNETIHLNYFLQIIKFDITEAIQDELYFELKIRSNLNRYYQQYCFDIENDETSEEVKKKMNNYLVYFNSLDPGNFKRFLQKIRPHKKICFSSLIEYTDGSINEDEIKDVFLMILSEIREPDNKKIGWSCKDLKSYHPTSIKESNSDAGKINISKKILNTALSTSIEVPFDSDFLITGECNVESIQLVANKISEVEELEPDKITSWRNVSLIDLETAKRKLNG